MRKKIPPLEGHGEHHFCHLSCAGRKYLCLGVGGLLELNLGMKPTDLEKQG